MAEPVITQEQKAKYLKDGGINCPRCGSESISPDPLETEKGGATGPCSCDDCDLTWDDSYELVGIENEAG
jgi:transcription elongation factor Elf1